MYGVSDDRDPLMLTRGKLYYRIIQQFHFLRRTKTTIIELCCSGRSMDEIVDRVLCYQSMPKGDSRGKPNCYGECDKAAFCKSCLNTNGTVVRLYRDPDSEKNGETGWDVGEKVSYTSYVKEEKHDTKEQMSILYQYKVHPSDILQYFSTSLMDYIYHIAKLRRQKHAHREQDHNFLPSILLLDIDFYQNFVYTDRITSIQSDHWSSASVAIFVAVLRYLNISVRNKSPISLKKDNRFQYYVQQQMGAGMCMPMVR